ncbi:hypothetical protein [Zhenhengia yiwuensis]|uniref:hypothetical protein n=1 Tax=Zhenhengia yiwuensis TaxID=2763666 RepID=UPI002A74E0D9|nr:hypothetical protein [Zhenhengia yiwuensis]MDY3368811.1 hypothetical protein [Zhenhengia yiwuensis]
MLVEIICLLKTYGFFEDKEQEEVYAFIKKLNTICIDCKKCGEESTQQPKDYH